MVNVMGLLHGACAAIMMSFAIGIYQTKPQPALIESRLAASALPVRASIFALLVLLFVSGQGVVASTLELPFFFVDMIGLIIHEGGHFFTSWAGRFVHVLGGTLFEIGVPAGLAIWVLLSGNKRLGAIALSWLYVALMSAAAYAGDAQDLQASLLGASDLIEDKIASHDWHNILSMLNLLDATPIIADIIWSMGLVTGLSSVLLYGWTMYTDWTADGVLNQKLS